MSSRLVGFIRARLVAPPIRKQLHRLQEEARLSLRSKEPRPSVRQSCDSATLVEVSLRELYLDGSGFNFFALARVSLGSCQWRGMNSGGLRL